MEFDFENYCYFGHATSSDPNKIFEKGLIVNLDVYDEQKLESTTLEITEEDLRNGTYNMLEDVFSIGKMSRKYVVIIYCEKEDYEIFKEDVENKHVINSDNILGFFDEYNEFYENTGYTNIYGMHF